MAKRFLQGLVRVLAVLFIALLFLYAFRSAKSFGYRIFADEAKDGSGSGQETAITVTAEESALAIAKDLEAKEIVDSAYVFYITLRCSEEYEELEPGTYILSSEMKPSEILTALTGEETEE